MDLEIYGASDDLIEMEGDIRDEWDAVQEGPYHFNFTDGTHVIINYGRGGEWSVNLMASGSLLERSRFVPSEGRDSKNYSDHLFLTFTDTVGFQLSKVIARRGA